MILTAQNHAREIATALRVYLVVSGLPGVIFRVSLDG